MLGKIPIALAFALCMSGCAPPAPPTPQTYIPVDIDKWVSGMFMDQYADRPLVVEGYFLSLTSLAFLQPNSPTVMIGIAKYSSADIGNAAQNPSSAMAMTQSNVIADVPVSLRDQIFALKQWQHIRVYGRAEQVTLLHVWHLKVYRIEIM